MKPQQRRRGFQTVAAGVSLILVLGDLEIVGQVEPAQQGKPVQSEVLANRTYLYGEVPQPEQVNKGYVVFAHQNGEVTGAFYYPLSEFDCFTGAMKNNTLEVQSVGVGDSEPVMVKVELAALHPIPNVSTNDQRILASCKDVIAAHNKHLPVSTGP